MAGVLALRLLPTLLLCGGALAALARAGFPAARALGLVAPLLVCAAAPAAPQVLANAHRYRLNENLAAAISRASSAAALALLPLFAVTASVSAAAGSVLPFMVAVGGVAAAVAGVAGMGAAGLLAGPRRPQQQQGPKGKVRMVYSPPAADAAADAAPPAAKQQQQQADAPPTGVSAESSSNGSAAAEAGTAADTQQQQRRPSPFSDVDKPPQAPQALQRSSTSRLRWRQPQALLPRRRHVQPRTRPAALPTRQLTALH